MKKKSIVKISIVILIAVLGFTQFESGIAHAANEEESNMISSEVENKSITDIEVKEIKEADKPFKVHTYNGISQIAEYHKEYDSNYPNIVIPEVIDGATITEIGQNVFKDQGLVSVEMPDTIKSIGDNAFQKNPLESVKLSQNLTLISSTAFADNLNLKHIEIPDSVITINSSAFRDSGLESVKLSKNLEWLGTCSFMNNMIKSVTIPGTVTEWGQFAFANNAIETVVVEEGVKTVGSDFMNSSGFGSNMFNKVSSLTLPSTAESIGYFTFAQGGLLYFDLPASVKTLGDDCFLEQKVTMDYTVGKDKSIVKLPKEMTMSKFNVSAGVTIDSANHEISIPKGTTKINYNYKLGTFSGVERFLTGTLTLGQGRIKVRFLDYDDSVLEEVNTVINETVVPTKTPTREGYTFIGWDKSLDNITESQDIKAQYKRLPEITVEDKLIKVGDSFNPLKDVKAIDADGDEIKDIKVIENTVNTTKEGTYYVTLEVSDQWGGKTTKQYKVIVESEYIDRILADDETGISVEGSFTKESRVIIELTPSPVTSLNDRIKGKDLISSYEVHVIGEYQGKLKIRFPLDKETNGTKIYIYHEKNNGEIEEFERIVNNDFIEITVDELSPFALAKDIQKPDIKPDEPILPNIKPDKPLQPNIKPDEIKPTPNDSVQTGDYINIMIPIIFLTVAGIIIISSKKYKKHI